MKSELITRFFIILIAYYLVFKSDSIAISHKLQVNYSLEFFL